MVFRTPEKQDRTVWFWVKIAAAALVLGFGVWLMFFQNISVSLSETELYVTGGAGNSRTVPYADITGVEWLQMLDKGEANNAMRTRTIQAGEYLSESYGFYYLYTRADASVWVKVDSTDGVLVFSGRTDEETKELYDMLLTHVAAA